MDLGDAQSLAYANAGPVQRVTRRSASVPALMWLYIRIQRPIDRLVWRLTGGRTTASSWLSGLPVVMLTTTGAKSGRRHTLPVLAIPDGETLIVIASNYGLPRNPAWYQNLRVNRRAAIRAGSETWEVDAHEVTGAERARYYQRGIDLYPPFIAYRKRATNREIPVVRLIPAP
jgi:deazaflavin-dependent oxidoreductase (nitroreductase family)